MCCHLLSVKLDRYYIKEHAIEPHNTLMNNFNMMKEFFFSEKLPFLRFHKAAS